MATNSRGSKQSEYFMKRNWALVRRSFALRYVRTHTNHQGNGTSLIQSENNYTYIFVQSYASTRHVPLSYFNYCGLPFSADVR